MGVKRDYSSGKFALELEGKTAGFLKSIEGGERVGTVVSEKPGEDGIAKKHLGRVDVEPITFAFGVGLSKELYQWISEACDRQQKPRSGAIVFLKYDFTEVERLEWKNGLITDIVFPPLDTSSKGPAFITVTIAPEQTKLTPSNGKAQPGFSTKTPKKWLSSNFRFSVSQLESASAKVRSVDGLSISQSVTRDDLGDARNPQRHLGTLQISNVLVTLPLSAAQPWLDWVHDFLVKGNNDDAAERTATLQLLDPTLKEVLFTVTLFHVGPVRARRQVATSGIDRLALVELELYCESVSFVPGGQTAGSTVASSNQAASSQPSGSSSTDAMLAVLSAAGASIDLQRALRVMHTGSIAGSPELVAARLKAMTLPGAPATPQRNRVDGELLGERWASEHASLEELQQIAPLEAGDWTSIQLDDEHTLVEQLQQSGIVPPGGEGAMQLERDEFVEGVVAGAARVLRAALPHISEVTPGKSGP